MKQISIFWQGRSRLIKRVVAIAVLAMSLMFLGYSLYANWQQLRDYHWQFNYFYLVLAALALFLAFVSNVLGWNLIIKRLGGPRAFHKNTEIYCLAAHGKRMPGLVWYVAGRAYLYEREAVPPSVVVQGSVWEMVSQLLSGLIIYTILLPSYWSTQYKFFNYLLLATIPLSLIFLIPSLFQRVLRWLRRDQKTVNIIQIDWWDKALWLTVYLMGWLAGGAILYFLTGAVSPVSLSFLPACWGFVALSGIFGTLTFFLPGGLGAREVSLSLLLSSYLPLSVAITLAVLFRMWILAGETVLLTMFWTISKSYLWSHR